MADLYPLSFTPVLKHYLWGGWNLIKLGRSLPPGKRVAESWEIASHADGTTAVNNGHFAGKTLTELMRLLGQDLVGRNNQWAIDRGIFPLMVKLLDAEQRLSVQVHPDDDFARKNEGNELGKAEMWVVLWAKPEAKIIYGFSKEVSPQAFRDAINTGSPEPYLHAINVKAGDHICVPPGTLHAILEGVMMVEFQQNSNTTYRVFDWNRTDDKGNPRSLHIEQAMDVINFQQINTMLAVPDIIEKTERVQRERLCQNAYFTAERVSIKQGAEYLGCCDGSTLEIWGCISGQASIAGTFIEEVGFCLLPASLGNFSIQTQSDSVLLRLFTE